MDTFMSMNRGTRLLQGMRSGEGIQLHAFLVDAHRRRHARDVALEVADRRDHLPGEADVGDRRRAAVAEAAGLLFVLQVRLDILQRLQRPVLKPAVARRLIDLQLPLEEVPYPRHDERMAVGRGDESESPYARAAARV